MAVGVVEGKKHVGIWNSDILAKPVIPEAVFEKRFNTNDTFSYQTGHHKPPIHAQRSRDIGGAVLTLQKNCAPSLIQPEKSCQSPDAEAQPTDSTARSGPETPQGLTRRSV